MRIRTLDSPSEMEPIIDDYTTRGYGVIRGAEYALVKKTSLFRTVDEVLLQLGERTDILQKHDENLRRCRLCGAPKRCKKCGAPQPLEARYCEMCGVFLLDFRECVDFDAVLSIGVICVFFILSVFVR
jgi:hypothetical protein